MRKQKYRGLAVNRQIIKRTRPLVILTSSLHTFALMLVLLVGFFGNTGKSNAASYTWDGGGVDNNWSTCANWSTNICPTATDNVTFNSASTKNAIIDAAWGGSVAGFTIASTYSGTITMERSLTTSGTLSQAGGTFTADNQTLDMNGSMTLSGGNFTASSNTTTLAGALTISGTSTFTHNNGTWSFDGVTSAALACSNKSFNLVTFTHTTNRTKTIGADCSFNVGNNPALGGDANADITLNGTLVGTGTLQVGTGASGNALTLGSTAMPTGFTSLAVGSFISTNYSADMSAFTSFVVNSTYTQSGGTISVPSGADFNGVFSLDTAAIFNAPSGVATFASTFTLNTGTTFNANEGTVTFDGATGVLSCNNTSFNLVTFASGTSAKTVGSNCLMPLGNDPTINGRLTLNGTLSGTGTVTQNQVIVFNTTAVLEDFSGWIANNTFSMAGADINFGSYSVVDINAFFNFSTGTFTAPSGVMTVSSVFLDSAFTGTFNHNNGTVVFDGNNIQQFINSSVTFYNLTATTPSQMTFKADKTVTVLGTLTLQGLSNRYIALTSSVPGTQWQIDPQGPRSVSYINVTDSNNINTTAINGSHFENGGNNINWNFDGIWRDISYRSDLRKTINNDGLRHMGPNLIKLADGRLAMIYAANAGTLPSSVVQYSSDLGATWTSPVELFANDNPLVVSVLEDGTVLAFHCTLDINGKMETYVQRSTDNMQTWGSRDLVRFDIPGAPEYGHFSSTAGPVVELTNGDLLLPLTHRYDRGTGWVISHDEGISWEYGGLWTAVPDEGQEYNEPWVDYLDDGSLMVIIRANTNNDRWIARSFDDGVTWTTPELAFGGGAAGGGLPSWIQLASGVVVVFNRGSGQDWTYRVSRDRGETWNEQVYFDSNRMQYGDPLEVAPGTMAFAYSISTSGSESGPQTVYFNYFVDRSEAAITTTSLPDGTVASSYNQTVATTGTQGTTSYSISAGALPAGLSLNSTTGAISGIPLLSGSYSFTISVNDDGVFDTALGDITTQPDSDDQAFTLIVANPPLPDIGGGAGGSANNGLSTLGVGRETNEAGAHIIPATPNTGNPLSADDDKAAGLSSLTPEAIGSSWFKWLYIIAGLFAFWFFLLFWRRRSENKKHAV